MRVAVCFDGVEDESLAAAAAEFVRGYQPVESWCAYGDAAERLVEQIAERHHGPLHPPHPPRHANLDEEQAQAIADRGVLLFRHLGIAATSRAIGGRDAEHAIVEASDAGVMLLLSAGHRGGTGPRSVGHVARFVVDHARGPVLLLRP